MVDLQSTNRTRLSKVRETTFGVIPTNPVFKEVRNTSSSLQSNPQTTQSGEIREDRQLTDLILVGFQAGGDIGGELSFEAHDDDLEEALQGTWDAKPFIEVLTLDTEISDVSTTTLTVASALGTPFKTGMLVRTLGFTTAANNKFARVSSSSATTVVFPASTFTAQASVNVGAEARVVGFEGASGDLVATVTGGNALTSTALDFTTLEIAEGDWLKIGGGNAGDSFATAALNDWVRVSGVAAQRLDLDVVPSGWVADAGTGKTLRVFYGDRLTNASTKRSNTFERQYLDHSPTTYEYLRGQTLNQLVMTLGPQAVLQLTKTYVGKDAYLPDPMARVSGATDVAAPTNEVMNTSQDVAAIMMDGAIVDGPNFVMNFTVTINNNLRQQNAIGSLGAVGIGNGEFNVTLSALQTYFGDPELARKVQDGTDFSFMTRFQSPSSSKESYVIDLPRCEMQTGAPQIAGKNNDVMLQGSAQALYDPDFGYTMAIHRFWYLP